MDTASGMRNWGLDALLDDEREDAEEGGERGEQDRPKRLLQAATSASGTGGRARAPRCRSR
jgi:hypothetical protein